MLLQAYSYAVVVQLPVRCRRLQCTIVEYVVYVVCRRVYEYVACVEYMEHVMRVEYMVYVA